jgi:hypothetical protein
MVHLLVQTRRDQTLMKRKVNLSLAALLMIFSAFVSLAASPANNAAVIGQPTIFWRNNRWETSQDGKWISWAEACERRRHHKVGQGVALRDASGLGQPNVSIGQTAIGSGKPNGGIGQPNVALGENNFQIGRPNAGIGRRNFEMGQPTIGIGQTTIAIGQPTLGIGQPNFSIAQPTIGIGQPTIGIGQPAIGIGKQRESIGRR